MTLPFSTRTRTFEVNATPVVVLAPASFVDEVEFPCTPWGATSSSSSVFQFHDESNGIFHKQKDVSKNISYRRLLAIRLCRLPKNCELFLSVLVHLLCWSCFHKKSTYVAERYSRNLNSLFSKIPKFLPFTKRAQPATIITKKHQIISKNTHGSLAVEKKLFLEISSKMGFTEMDIEFRSTPERLSI